MYGLFGNFPKGVYGPKKLADSAENSAEKAKKLADSAEKLAESTSPRSPWTPLGRWTRESMDSTWAWTRGSMDPWTRPKIFP